jgi:hypothetical protein
MLKAKTKFEFSESEAGSAAGDIADTEKSGNYLSAGF